MTASLPQSTPALTILIADDHWVVRESLKQVARSIDPSVDIKEAATLEQAISVLERYPLVGLILVDLVMPGMNEFEGLELLRRRFPTIAIAVITIHEDPNYVRQAIQNGVIGYIPKSASADEIRRAFTRIFGGEVYFPRDLLTRSWTVPSGCPCGGYPTGGRPPCQRARKRNPDFAWRGARSSRDCRDARHHSSDSARPSR